MVDIRRQGSSRRPKHDMATSATKAVSALLVLSAGITANPIPVPNPLYHEPQPLYSDIGPVYPFSDSLFAEQNAVYPYRDSNPYLPESLVAELDGPLAAEQLAGGAEMFPDQLTGEERSQLLGLLTGELLPAEGDDYGPLGYDLPPPVDADWYEALGLASPYDSEDLGGEYGDYIGEVVDEPLLPSGPSRAMTKKDTAASETRAEQPAEEDEEEESEDDDDDDDDDDDADGGNVADDESENTDDAAANLVKQIEELRKTIHTEGLRHPSQSAPQTPDHPVRSPSTPAPAVEPGSGDSSRSVSAEAPLADQLRAAAAEPTAAPLTDSETAYETIKRFLVMEDALKRVSQPS
ncbi:hypothetical protein FJT64_017794 [Amphibalanus amphitrite]|uniref:Uncharacterized protein n=1 Tax=Amphibalanus amphitrite TaxID=1232801 RepID=A0A6A4WW86_AMPAM|nr:hypothetical protein FJT64_017794 [Amphibalanus amphitrite]